jgi:hypothetical protein
VGILIGLVLASAVGLAATAIGLDRDRAFYPTVMIVIAAYYVLFAVMGGGPNAILYEAVIGAAFVAAAIAGFRSSLWLVVAALAGHGVFDLAHAKVISNPGVPEWWPEFCFMYDVTAAGYLAWLLKQGRTRAAP